MITMVDLMETGGGVPEDELVTRQRQMAMGDRREVAHKQKASKYRTAVLSMLNRTGHARFRRGPVAPPASAPSEAAPARPPAALDFARCDGFSASASASSSFPSSVTGVTGEGSLSNGRALLSTAVLGYSAGGKRPPLMQSASDYSHGLKRSYDDENHALRDNAKRAAHGGGRCHCSKKRKSRLKRSIRVPAISSRNADIPPDDYSWRKYGQKPIKGSPYPRGYYKCSTVLGCPARKHVERDPGEPAMLIVTYEGDHRHAHDGTAARTPELALDDLKSSSLIS